MLGLLDYALSTGHDGRTRLQSIRRRGARLYLGWRGLYISSWIQYERPTYLREYTSGLHIWDLKSIEDGTTGRCQRSTIHVWLWDIDHSFSYGEAAVAQASANSRTALVQYGQAAKYDHEISAVKY